MVTQTLQKALFNRYSTSPDDEALIFLYEDRPAQHITNQQLHCDALRCANAYAQAGVVAGETMLLVFEHSYELATAFWGALYLGAIPSVFSYFSERTTPIAYVQRANNLTTHAEINTVVSNAQWCDSLAEAMPQRQIIELAPLLAQAKPDPSVLNFAATSPADAAFLQFSSGTTGFPKGVMLSHESILNSIAGMAVVMQSTADDVSVTWAPFYHEMGMLLGFLMPLVVGAKAVLISPFHWVKTPAILFQAIQKYGGTSGWMPNFGYDVCMRRVRDEEIVGLDLSAVRMFGNGSEPVRADTIAKFNKHFAPYGLRPNQTLTAYGLAENVVLVTTSKLGSVPHVDIVSAQGLRDGQAIAVAADSADSVSFVSNGVPIPGAKVIIAHVDQQPLPERSIGEILLRSNSLFGGYYLRPDLSAEALRNGWLHTGDLGYLLDGELYICERKKDLIVAGGQNIYPDSIEAIAQQVLGKQGARVVAFGIYSEDIGTETPTLLCELRKPADATERRRLLQTIRQQVVQQLDVALGDVRFVEKGWIQRTTSGKLARRANRDHYLATYFENVAVVTEGSLLELITSLVERALDIRPISSDRNIFELGFDSLRFMQLFAQIEAHIDRPIPVARFLEQPTIQHLVACIEDDVAAPALPPERKTVNKRPSSRRRKLGLPKNVPAQLRRVYLRGTNSRDLPYGATSQVLWWLGNQKWMQKRLIKKELTLLQSAFSEIKPVDTETTIGHSIASNIWKLWRVRALRDPETFRRWVSFSGLSHFEQALQAGNGVILIHNHGALRRVFDLLPSHLAPDVPTVTVGATRPSHLEVDGFVHWAEMKSRRSIANETILTGQMLLGRQTLQQGGVVQLMGDGLRGESGVEVAFFGRKRPFRLGFAHLSISTNAPALPTFITLTPPGHIHVSFHKPLHSTADDPAEQMNDLVKQYAARLQAHWQENAGAIAWKQLIRFQSLPTT